MTRNRRLSGLAALLLAVVWAAPAAAENGPANPIDPEVQKRLEALQRDIEENRKLLNALMEVQNLKQRVEALERQMADMQTQSRERISRAAPQTGTIRLENRLAIPATIIVNGTPQRLNPGETRDLPGQPAGTFTYQILVDPFGMIQPPTTRTLQANQVYHIYTYQP